MKIIIIICLFLSIPYFVKSQIVTDSDIVKSIMNKDHFKVNSILDSLGVWYKFHMIDDLPERDIKIYSIANSNGTVKVYVLKLYSGSNQKSYSNKIIEIIINCRHDSREQIEDAMKFTYPAKFKVGKYSTDIIAKSDLL